MNKILALLSFISLLTACQHTELPEPEKPIATPSPAVPEFTQVTFDIAQSECDAAGLLYDDPQTRIADNELRDVNLYIFNPDVDFAYHAYLQGGNFTSSIFLPKGYAAIYCIGNIGYDMGAVLSQTELINWPFEAASTNQLPTASPAISTLTRRMNISDQTTLSLRMIRLTAMITANITLDDALGSDAVIVSVTPGNVPARTQLNGSYKLAAGEPVIEYSYRDLSASKLRSYSYTYYQFSNKQDLVASIHNEKERNQTNAPKYASFFVIRVLCRGAYYDYRVYPGAEYGITDFSVMNNKHYRYDVRIYGTNPEDLRISKTEFIFWAGRSTQQYRNIFEWQSNAAYCTLCVSMENGDPQTEYSLAFQSLSGTFKSGWYMQAAATPYSATPTILKEGKLFPVHTGNGKSYLYLTFINTDGKRMYSTTDNMFNFILTDGKGFRANYKISTNPADKK